MSSQITLRLNGKKLFRNYNVPLRLRCQHCSKICRTRHLDHDVVCEHCRKYAKRAEQETRPVTSYDKSNKMQVITYIVKYPENPIEAILP